MIKLKKKLTGLKIRRFFKANNLVLFFHHNNSKKNWHSTHTTKLLWHRPGTQQANTKWHQPQEASTAQVTSFLLKNKIAQKVFAVDGLKSHKFQTKRTKRNYQEILHKKMLEKQKYKKDFQLLQNRTEEHKIFHKTNITELLFNATRDLSKNKNDPIKQLYPLFQGPTILLALNHISFLENVLNTYKQENSFFLLGGVYHNKVLLNEKNVQKLVQLSKTNANGLNVIKALQKRTQPFVCVLKKALDISILNVPRRNLLRLLLNRKLQLTLL